MTAPTMTPDFSELSLEDVAIPCENLINPWGEDVPDNFCSEQAAWIVTKKCCGAIRFMCEDHHSYWSQWYGDGKTSRCLSCCSVCRGWLSAERL